MITVWFTKKFIISGMYAYQQIMAKYIQLYQSKYCTLAKKVELASSVITFLRIWHDHVAANALLSTSVHFITREAYQDTLLSAHSAVTIIAFMAKMFPRLACRLDLTGTDTVENFWSKVGQFEHNRHKYTMADLSRSVSHMIR